MGVFVYVQDSAKGTALNPLSNKPDQIGAQLLDPFASTAELDRYVNIEFVQYD